PEQINEAGERPAGDVLPVAAPHPLSDRFVDRVVALVADVEMSIPDVAPALSSGRRHSFTQAVLADIRPDLADLIRLELCDQQQHAERQLPPAVVDRVQVLRGGGYVAAGVVPLLAVE